MGGVDVRERFAGRSAIVTGAGSGIGAALSRALVSAGANVVCADLDLEAADRTVASVTGPGSARAVRLDVTSAPDVAALVESVAAEHGSLDLLFNNAGISIGGETQELTLEHWDSIIDVNIRGVVHGVHAAYPLMVRQRSGHIVNTASMGGLMAAGLLTSYVMTKHAVVGLSMALRSEAAAFGVGVTAGGPEEVVEAGEQEVDADAPRRRPEEDGVDPASPGLRPELLTQTHVREARFVAEERTEDGVVVLGEDLGEAASMVIVVRRDRHDRGLAVAGVPNDPHRDHPGR